MARRPHPRTSTAQYRGVTIRFYRHRNRWKSTFQLHGHKRRECYGATREAAQLAAETAIGENLIPEAIAANRDEVTARALLADYKVSLTEAARCWLSRHAKPLKTASVTEVRDRWLALCLETKGHHYARSLRARSRGLAEAFGPRPVASVTQAELIDWQDSLELKYQGRTVRNIHDATKQFFKFARKRNYLDNERLSPMEMIDRPRAPSARKEIYTPLQMQRLLDAAWAIGSPAAASMAIAAFTAIRTEEIAPANPERSDRERLAWEDFRWRENFIHVREEIAKLKNSRHVPLRKNLREMLLPLLDSGPIYPKKRLDLAYARIARKAGVPWKRNGLRHSAITYDMLLSPSPAQVANRAGNSVATIESNYRNRGATKAQAIAWFKLLPRILWTSDPSMPPISEVPTEESLHQDELILSASSSNRKDRHRK